VRRHEHGTALRFLYYNTYLIHAPGLHSAPDRTKRRHEIGRALAASDYDVAGLVEVFRDPEKEAIKEKFDDRRIHGINGPAARTEGISSGLWTLLMGDRVDRRESVRRAFSERGTGLFDFEERANKGMSYVEIGVGDGIAIDFFLTHLHAEDERTRRAQIAELAEFILDVKGRKRANVAILAGDFNVDFNDDECEELYRVMATCKLYDASLAYAGRAGATAWRTAAPRREERRAPVTMRTEWYEPAQDICRFDPDAPGGEYCDDYHVPATTTDPRLRFRDAVPGHRIDYLFVEEPSPDHSFSLDLSRIRRRHFWRGESYAKGAHKRRIITYIGTPSATDRRVEETPFYMSDHLGLEFECIVCRVSA